MPITVYGAIVARLRQGMSALDLILGRAQAYYHPQCTSLERSSARDWKPTCCLSASRSCQPHAA